MSWIRPYCFALTATVLLLALGSALMACERQESPASNSASSTAEPTATFEELKSAAVQLTYDDLFRNNEEYVGKTVWYMGEIIQVIDGGENEYQLRVNVTKEQGYWDDTVLLKYSGPRLLENDIIEFVARINGLVTYDAIMGNKITIPDLTAIASKISEEPVGSPPSRSGGIAVSTPTPESRNLTPASQGHPLHYQQFRRTRLARRVLFRLLP